MAPNSSVSITHISKQYFVLGQPDSSLWAGDQEGKWKWELSSSSGSCRSFALWVGTSAWPSALEGWLQMFYQLVHSIWQP